MMEWWNDGILEWWNDGILEWWNDGFGIARYWVFIKVTSQ